MKDSIIEIMTEILKIEKDELLENFDSREIWDSLLRVEILFAVEEEFDIQFDEEELAELDNLVTANMTEMEKAMNENAEKSGAYSQR